MNKLLAEKLVSTLPVGRLGLFNPWKESCVHDSAINGPEQRLERLAMHLDCPDARFLMVGEAPGYQGCRYSGVAFTSERLLLEGVIPRISLEPEFQLSHEPLRLTDRHIPFSEPSATTVWGTLKEHKIDSQTLLWNGVQLHPHLPGEPWTNRTPSDEELMLGEPALRILLEAFPGITLVAIGQKSAQSLIRLGFKPDALVRHPSMGGTSEFKQGITSLMAQPVA